MSFVKYRVKEVAADFGISPKEVSDIVSKFYDRPKSYTQVLNDSELNVVFEYMTQKNQIKDISQVFAVAAQPKAEPAKQEAPKAEQTAPSQTFDVIETPPKKTGSIFDEPDEDESDVLPVFKGRNIFGNN